LKPNTYLCTCSLHLDSIRAANDILPSLSEDDPGLIVQIPNISMLHVALGLAGSPVVPGVDAQASYDAFMSWLRAQAALEPGVTVANSISVSAWHHLSDKQATNIVGLQWHNPTLQWLMSIRGYAVPLGHVAEVIKVTGTGRGRAEMFLCEPVFY
jgi:hypothetical protein